MHFEGMGVSNQLVTIEYGPLFFTRMQKVARKTIRSCRVGQLGCGRFISRTEK